MKKKNLLYSILSFAIVFAVYCIVFLVIPFPKSASSWVSFGFTALAICLCGAVFAYAFGGKDLKSKIYGIPVFKIALIYAAVQLLAGIVICIIAAFVTVPAWIPTVLYVILLALGALGFIVTDSAKSTIEEIDSATENVTQTFAKLRMEVAGAIDICTDTDTYNKLKQLEESFRYSDPVSCHETEELERDLLTETVQLRALVKEKNFNSATALADEIKIGLAERNRVCKMYKTRDTK